MRKVKQIVLFILVVVTIYWTMLFYLLMSVHSDSRLQEIDYLEKIKPQGSGRLLYIDKIIPLTDRFTYFSISKVSHKIPKPAHCSKPHSQNTLLIIAASSFDPITIYSKILRQFEVGIDGCQMPEVLVLKRIRPLILNNEQNINKYTSEIGEIIKYLTIEQEIELSIFTHDEGALLLLNYFATRPINLLFSNVVQKIKTILLVDPNHPFIRIQNDPPFQFINQLKIDIASSKERLKIFNKLRIVVITTHKEDGPIHRFQLAYGEELFVFQRTLLISSREMANVHYFLPPNSLSFPPLVRRLAHFLAKDFVQNLSTKEIASFLRHGESYSYEKVSIASVQACSQNIQAQKMLNQYKLIIYKQQCIKLNPTKLSEQQAILIYSANHFLIYSNNHHRIYPFDNLTEGSVYIFRKIHQQIYIINQDMVQIYISKQRISNPKHPLPISTQEINLSSQLIFSNYTVLKICPNIILMFPLHFAQGNLRRSFLDEDEGQCFQESSFIQQFSWQFFVNWGLFRNMIILAMICSIFTNVSISDRLISQILINILLLTGRHQIKNKFINALYLASFTLLIEYGIKTIVYLCQHINLKQKWASFVLLAVSAVCILGSAFNIFNYWRIFLIAVIFFINDKNITVFVIKLYFLKDQILYGCSSLEGLTSLGLLTMWLYTSLSSSISLPNKLQLPSSMPYNWPAQKIFTASLLTVLGLTLDSSGSTIDTIITIYMKVMVVLRILRILKKK